MNYKVILFDFDYTLGDSTESIIAGFAHGLSTLGHPVPSREVIRNTIGLLLEDAYTLLTGDEDLENRAQFRILFREIAMPRQREETILFPGADALLRGLHDKGINLGIVSTKIATTIEYVFHRLGLSDAVSLVIGSADVIRHKPDPEGLLMAMERLGVTKDEVLFCGDTLMDCGAAQNAGVDFAAVLNGTTPADAFSDQPHVAICDDLWELGRYLELELHK